MRALSIGSEKADLGPEDIEAFVSELLGACEAEYGRARRVLLVPPDQTRKHSRSGEIALSLAKALGPSLKAVLPATGTHRAMGEAERSSMFPGLDESLFLDHDHRKACVSLGGIEAGFVEDLTDGRLSFSYPGEFNRDLVEGGWDLVVSMGQVVPHEVVGMANYTKNTVVGLGGARAIDLSHWLGAVAGLENLMGRADTPVRRLLDESATRFTGNLPIVYILSVLSPRPDGSLALRGLFAGPNPGPLPVRGEPGLDPGREAYRRAAGLSARLNIDLVERPIETCVVSLDPAEFRSTWIGNKAVYRTRMAMADGGELFVLAPGVDRFGEDPAVDALIRRHGYRGTEATLDAAKRDPELAACLAAAAHLIHGSDEGRFRITYCTEPAMRDAILSVGYGWADLDGLRARFGLAGGAALPREGWNRSGGEDYFYVSNPALGLWKVADR